ncbi:MAG: M23 family metallopeptidase [Candidatus Omnitrophota bacterium]|nr:M23 family metallopeptidase [Candidatus Omnitrophota bacterium]
MKRLILILFLISLPLYLVISLYFLDKVYFLCPIEYKTDIIIRNDNRGEGYFGARRNGNRLHQGVDFFAETGVPVRASCFGMVITVSESPGMGKYIVLKHAYGITTLYGHLSKIFITHHQLIRQGQIIGSVGKTGNANHPVVQSHLHFEVRKNNIPVDPLGYLE